LRIPSRRSAKPQARAAALSFLKDATAETSKASHPGAHQRLDTGMTDADLDAVVAGKPDAVVFPKAEGGATVVHLDAKLTAREAIAGLAGGSIKILAQAVESAAGLFAAGTYRDASKRLIGMTWGPEDLSAELGAEANRDRAGPAHRALSPRPQTSASTARPRRSCRRSRPSMSTSAIPTACASTPNTPAATASPGGSPFIRRRLAVINEVFTPTPAQIEKAKMVVAAFAASPAPARSALTARCSRLASVRAQNLLARIAGPEADRVTHDRPSLAASIAATRKPEPAPSVQAERAVAGVEPQIAVARAPT